MIYVFQSTHPSGVRRLCGFGSSWETDFNPRTPVGCDRTPPLNRSHSAIFQSTHPSGVRRSMVFVYINALIFQSTHPSGVRRCTGRATCCNIKISIHAPQWGATTSLVTCVFCCIFQSTHPSGVRHVSGRIDHVTVDYFNPRTPVGCDLLAGLASVLLRFQSTHPSGVRPLMQTLMMWPKLFQSTHPSGVRRTGIRTVPLHRNFNPRTPVGCDLYNSRRSV